MIEQYISPTGTNTAEVPSAVVSPGYFAGLGIPILHGRSFRPQDDGDAPGVAVVSEAMARRYWGTVDVVGRRYRHDGVPDSWVEIVGVVADVKVGSLTENPQPQLYRSLDQQGAFVMSYLVRTSGRPSGVVGTMGKVVRDYDPKLPIMRLTTIDDHVDEQLFVPRIAASVLAGFSLTRWCWPRSGSMQSWRLPFASGRGKWESESPWGARSARVVCALLRGIMSAVGAGLATGLLAARAAARAMSPVLFNVSPDDPLTIILVTGVLAAVAIIAAWVPALRATCVDPAVVLRYQ